MIVLSQSGVALRLPPHSKGFAGEPPVYNRRGRERGRANPPAFCHLYIILSYEPLR